jgi:hypothetical protein
MRPIFMKPNELVSTNWPLIHKEHDEKDYEEEKEEYFDAELEAKPTSIEDLLITSEEKEGIIHNLLHIYYF